MIKLAFAIAFLAVFGIVAYAVVVLLANKFGTDRYNKIVKENEEKVNESNQQPKTKTENGK